MFARDVLQEMFSRFGRASKFVADNDQTGHRLNGWWTLGATEVLAERVACSLNVAKNLVGVRIGREAKRKRNATYKIGVVTIH